MSRGRIINKLSIILNIQMNEILAINYYSLKKKRWYYFFNMTFSYILTQSSSSKGATAILLFFKKRKYHHNRELSSTSARYIFLKKTPRGLIEETKHPIKPVFSHHFNSFRAVFSSSSDSFFYTLTGIMGTMVF